MLKWTKDAKEAVFVAGGEGQGNTLKQLFRPGGLSIDHLSNVYVVDRGNHRVMRFSKGSREGNIVVGGYGSGERPHQLNQPEDISFDQQGNLYATDAGNFRVQKFNIDD